MLERTAGYLEPASLWRLVPASKKPLNCRRKLHPAFWNHAAGSIEHSPLWAALIANPDPQPEEISTERRGPDSTGGRFLWFLYPAGTTNFLRNYAGRVSDRQICRRSRPELSKLGRRLYSSSARDTSATSAVIPHEDGGRAPTIEVDSVGQKILRKKLGVRRLEDRLEDVQEDGPDYYDKVWHNYLSLDEKDLKQARSIVMECFFLSKGAIEAQRTIEIFNGLDPEDRSARAYHYAIVANLKLHNRQGAFQLYETVLSTFHLPVGSDELLAYLMRGHSWESACNIWSSARRLLKQYQNPDYNMYAVLTQFPHYGDLLCQFVKHVNDTLEGTSQDSTDILNDTTQDTTETMDDAAQGSNDFLNDIAQNPTDTLNNTPRDSNGLLKDTAQDSTDILNDAAQVSNDHLKDTAQDFHDTLKDTTQDPNEESPGLLEFAKTLSHKALLSHRLLSPTTLSTLVYYLHKWDALSPKAFEHAVRKLFEVGEQPLAVQLYRKLNGFDFTRTTLHTVLKFFCDKHHTRGMQQVINDFFRGHEKPSLATYKMCMTEFASQGDVETVYTLFGQLIDHHTSPEQPLNDPNFISPILHVHSKRGEMAEVLKTFNEITEKYNLRPSILCWNILIASYGRMHDIDKAFETFESLFDLDGIEPNGYTFATIMGIAVLRGDSERVVELYTLAEDLGVKKIWAMVDCVVQAHIQNNDLETAERVCETAATMGLDGSPTRMWNYLIVAYALRRDVDNARRVHHKMCDLRIDDDEYTYGAMMQALSMVGRPDQAHNILKYVLPDAGLKITNFHYAVLMGGYLAVGNVAKVFRLYEECINRNMQPSASTNLLLLKATVRPDSHLLEPGAKGGMFQRGIDMFLNLTTKSPQISKGPEKGVSGMPLDIAYPAALHSYMMYVAAQHGEFQSARDLYERYKSVVPKDRQDDPPLQIISALMATKWREGDLAGIEECWQLALARAKANVEPRYLSKSPSESSELAPENPGRVSYNRKLDLAKCLSIYLQALGSEGKVDQMAATIDELFKLGFALDSHNWNTYVKILCSRSRARLAFQVCESELMPEFTGWARVRRKLPVRNRLPLEIRRLGKDSRHCRPGTYTILALADVYMRLMDSATESPQSQYLLDDIKRTCRKTISAIESMPRTNEAMERQILGGE